VIRDRDQVYGAAATRRRRAMGIRDKPIAPGSPWQNGFAERLIGSIRRECVDHMVVLGEAHLRRILTKYAAYYNDLRTHRSLNEDAPIHRAIQDVGDIVSVPVLGGLHHHYCTIFTHKVASAALRLSWWVNLIVAGRIAKTHGGRDGAAGGPRVPEGTAELPRASRRSRTYKDHSPYAALSVCRDPYVSLTARTYSPILIQKFGALTRIKPSSALDRGGLTVYFESNFVVRRLCLLIFLVQFRVPMSAWLARIARLSVRLHRLQCCPRRVIHLDRP
jgi:hypothetical protein